MTANRGSAGGVADTTRMCVGGGVQSGVVNQSVIQYVTIATTGNATTFGNLTEARRNLNCGFVSSATRGVFGGGYSSGTTATMDYITIASTGNAISFGSLTNGIDQAAASCSNLTRGLFAGNGSVNAIVYITIASASNSTSFGQLITAGSSGVGVSNAHGGL